MNRYVIVLALIVAFLIGGWVGDEARPQPDRPVARFLGKVARLGLWMLILGEQPKHDPQYMKMAEDSGRIDHGRSL